MENPEGHLHPRGQAAMGELLSLAASTGKQIICETHSDHIINSVRVAVDEWSIQLAKLI
jgi:predicted ATPase